ncbi:hypothetical protein GCM10027515_04210 [Schumannella luteola]
MLLEAAVRVVAQHGLHGMTFRKVADEAGVNNSLVSHHFGSLPALAAGALDWSVSTALRDSHLPAFADSEQEYRDALRSTLADELDLHVYQYEMVLEASRDESLRPQIVDLYARYTAEIERSVFGDQPSRADRAAARAIFAAIDGLVLQFVGGAITPEDFDESVSAIWRYAESIRAGEAS